MNVLIHSQSYYVRNSFVAALIPRGIELYHAEHYDMLIDKLKSHKIEVLVLDVIQEDFSKVFEEMQKIKNYPEESIKKVAIILLVGAMDKQNVLQAIQSGAIGFIKSGSGPDVIADYIIQIYQKVKGVPPERKFVRVTLDTTNINERVAVKFRSPINSQLIMGVIKDISFGGIAVEIVGTYEHGSLETGIDIKNIQFILEGKDVYVDANVVAIKERICAFRFTGMPAQEREIVSQFIFQRMAAKNEKLMERPDGGANGTPQD